MRGPYQQSRSHYLNMIPSLCLSLVKPFFSRHVLTARRGCRCRGIQQDKSVLFHAEASVRPEPCNSWQAAVKMVDKVRDLRTFCWCACVVKFGLSRLRRHLQSYEEKQS